MFKKSEKKKNDDLQSCREAAYLKKICILSGILVFNSSIIYWKLKELFQFMPIYRSDECYQQILLMHPGTEIKKRELTLN